MLYIASSNSYSCAIKASDQSVVCWGTMLQANVPAVTGAVKLALEANTACALLQVRFMVFPLRHADTFAVRMDRWHAGEQALPWPSLRPGCDSLT